MIPRGGWRLTLRDLDGNIVQTESIEHPDKVNRKQPQRLFSRLFFYTGTAEGEMVFVEHREASGRGCRASDREPGMDRVRVIRDKHGSRVASDPELRRMPGCDIVHVSISGGSASICGEFGTTKEDGGGRICQKCARWLTASEPYLYVVTIDDSEPEGGEEE